MGRYVDLIVHNTSSGTVDNKRTDNYADISFDNRNNCNSLEGLDNLKSGSVGNFNGNYARALPTGSMEARAVSFDDVIEEVKLRSRSKARSSFQIKAQSCDSILNTSQLKSSTHDTNAVHVGQTCDRKCNSQSKTSKICSSRKNICDTEHGRNSVDNVSSSSQVMDTGVKSKEICSSQKKTPIKFCEWAPKEGIDITVPLYNTVSAYSVRVGGSHDKVGGVQPGSSYESVVSARGFRPSAAVVRSAGKSFREPRLHTGDGRTAVTEGKSPIESHKGGTLAVSVSGVSTLSRAAVSSHQSPAAVCDSKLSDRSSESKRQGAGKKATEVRIESVSTALESASKEAEESQRNPVRRNIEERPKNDENATEGIQAPESAGPCVVDSSSESENGRSLALDGRVRTLDSGEYPGKEHRSSTSASAKEDTAQSSSQSLTADQPESSTPCSSHSLVDLDTQRIAVEDNNVTAVRSLPNFTNVSNDSPSRRQTSDTAIDGAPPITGPSRVAQLVQSFSGRGREVEDTGQRRTPVTSRPLRSPAGKGVASTADRFGSLAGGSATMGGHPHSTLTRARSPAQALEEQQAREPHPSSTAKKFP